MRASSGVCMAVLAAALLAGCIDDAAKPEALQDRLSQAVHGIRPVERVLIASGEDGKVLDNWVFRPATDEPVPVWVNFSPYWGRTAELEGDAFARYMIHEYVPRGYAVVLSAVRGTGHSEGCFQLAGDLELQDAWDVVDYFSKAHWSNGRVGAGGKSYDSTTQNGLLAKLPHPALATVLHVSGITDFYKYNYRNGVPISYPSELPADPQPFDVYDYVGARYRGLLFNTDYLLAEGMDESGLSPDDLRAAVEDRKVPDAALDAGTLGRTVDDLACPELAQASASGVGSGALGLKDAFWQERDWTRWLADSPSTTSVFFVHGFQDWNVKPDHMDGWLPALLERDPPVKAWLHQWTRTPEGGHVYPMREDWNQTMLRWMDHFLKGVDTGVLDEPAVASQGSDGLWRTADSWPPAGTVREAFILDSLAPRSEAGRASLVGQVPLPAGQGLRIAGNAVLRVSATSDDADPVVTAVLYDRAPDGTFTWLNEAVLRAMYRNGLTEPTLVTPNTPQPYGLEFYPMDHVVQPGHTLWVEIGGVPRWVLPLPGAMESVTYNPSDATLELPVAPMDGLPDAQPAFMDCFACAAAKDLPKP